MVIAGINEAFGTVAKPFGVSGAERGNETGGVGARELSRRRLGPVGRGRGLSSGRDRQGRR